MTLLRLWKDLPFVWRLGLSGLLTGGLGGLVLVGLVVVLDIARLRTLLAMASITPSPVEWLTVPGVFAALGLAWTMTSGD